MEKSKNRVKRVIAKANNRLSIKTAAALLAGSTLLSSVLGIYRDRLLNGMYLKTYEVGIDAYTVAFTIPDFMFFILVSGALSVTFIPVFNARLAKGNKDSAWKLSTSMINFMALITLVASVLIMVFAPLLVKYVVGPGLNEQGQALAISMMRVIAVNPFLFAIATVIASIQQAVGRFVFFALAPTLYSIGIIIGTTFFTDGITIFGHEVFAGGIMGVALGVVLGAVLQLVVSSMGLIGLGFDYRFKIYWKNKGFRKVLSLLPARSFDQGIDYVSSIVDTNLASRMAAGTVRAYQQATTLYQMPINLIGVAISTAAFPQMSERLSQGRPDLFRKELRSVLRVIIWLALPVATIVFFARGYIVSIIVREGDALIAGLLGILALTILFRSVFQIASRSFYAQQDTRTPLYISAVSIVISISMALYFTFVLHMGPYGLAWAQVIWAFLEIAALLVVMSKRIPKLFNSQFYGAVARMLVSTAIMGVVSYFMVSVLDLEFANQSLLMVLPKLVIITVVSFSVYLGVSQALHLSEAGPVLKFIKKILFLKVK